MNGASNDIVYGFVSLLNARVPIKCRLCHKPIDISEGFFITPEGIYHVPCYYELAVVKKNPDEIT